VEAPGVDVTARDNEEAPMAFGRRFGPPIMHPNPVAEGEALSARDRLKAAPAEALLPQGRECLFFTAETGVRDMHTAIADKREELAGICRRYGVTRLEVFGSAARGADFDPETSDADFLVEFDPQSGLNALEQYFGLVDALCETLGRPVDLVENHEFRNPYLRASIDKSRELVYAS